MFQQNCGDLLDLPHLDKDKEVEGEESDLGNIEISTSSSSHQPSPIRKENEPSKWRSTPSSSQEIQSNTPPTKMKLFDYSYSKATTVPITPIWLEDTLSMKRKAIQLDLSKQYMVDQLLQITPNPKKLKTTARIIDDGSLGNLCLEVARPTAYKEVTQVTVSDFDIDRINLGPPTRDEDVHKF